ncbi:MAG: hypothetical protein M3R59_02955 [Verrucomicrobiota bacterium]|nr:hypothetical protein [Verrucomicrobiota bacterium]
MTKRLVFALVIFLACSVAYGQPMPQATWWDVWANYKYVSAGPANQIEQRKEKFAAMSEGEKQAAISGFSQEWLRMSFAQRKQAANDAWAWQRAHQGDVPVQHGTLHDDG